MCVWIRICVFRFLCTDPTGRDEQKWACINCVLAIPFQAKSSKQGQMETLGSVVIPGNQSESQSLSPLHPVKPLQSPMPLSWVQCQHTQTDKSHCLIDLAFPTEPNSLSTANGPRTLIRIADTSLFKNWTYSYNNIWKINYRKAQPQWHSTQFISAVTLIFLFCFIYLHGALQLRTFRFPHRWQALAWHTVWWSLVLAPGRFKNIRLWNLDHHVDLSARESNAVWALVTLLVHTSTHAATGT